MSHYRGGYLSGEGQALIEKLAAQDILDKVKTVDGSGSGLDADTVRGTTPTSVGLGLLAVSAQPANADTSGATLAQLETEVNELKALLRTIGVLAV